MQARQALEFVASCSHGKQKRSTTRKEETEEAETLRAKTRADPRPALWVHPASLLGMNQPRRHSHFANGADREFVSQFYPRLPWAQTLLAQENHI
jgi:hypothetical protein